MVFSPSSAERQGWQVFLDTNVVFAGLLSLTGASAAIRQLGEAGEILIVVSRQVLVESDRAMLIKFPSFIDRYRAFIQNANPFLVDDPPADKVHEAEAVIDPGDAPIVAAAKRTQVDYLVTLDTRHFRTAKVRAFLPIPILTPAELLTEFRRFWESL